MKKEKVSFLFYFDWQEQMDMLSDKQCRRFVENLIKYNSGREDEMEFIDKDDLWAWKSVKHGVESNIQKYENKCESNRENGKLGGRPKKNQTVNLETQKTERLFEKPNGLLENPKNPIIDNREQIIDNREQIIEIRENIKDTRIDTSREISTEEKILKRFGHIPRIIDRIKRNEISTIQNLNKGIALTDDDMDLIAQFMEEQMNTINNN